MFIHILVTKINVTSEGMQSFQIQTSQIPGPLGLQISTLLGFIKLLNYFKLHRCTHSWGLEGIGINQSDAKFSQNLSDVPAWRSHQARGFFCNHLLAQRRLPSGRPSADTQYISNGSLLYIIVMEVEPGANHTLLGPLEHILLQIKSDSVSARNDCPQIKYPGTQVHNTGVLFL